MAFACSASRCVFWIQVISLFISSILCVFSFLLTLSISLLMAVWKYSTKTRELRDTWASLEYFPLNCFRIAYSFCECWWCFLFLYHPSFAALLRRVDREKLNSFATSERVGKICSFLLLHSPLCIYCGLNQTLRRF